MKIHMDLDCFFVSAERTLDTSLRGVPAAVGGRGDNEIFSHTPQSDKELLLCNKGAFVPLLFSSVQKQSKSFQERFVDEDGRIRGIITAASYEARKYGIRTGTTVREALLLCPHIKIVPPNHRLYHILSHDIYEYLKTEIPVMEQYSIDEFFGDLSGWVEDEAAAHAYCLRLQKGITERFGVPMSFGIYKDSKWIAKLATGFAKPYGVKLVKIGELEAFIKDIKIEEFPGIGRGFQKKLKSYFIETLGEAAQKPHLFAQWGTQGRILYKKICGKDNESVAERGVRKSIGISRTFDPIKDREELRRRIAVLARHLSHTILHLGLNPTTFYFSISYEYAQKSKCSFTEDRLFHEFYYIALAKKVFTELDTYPHTKVIKLSLSVSNFTSLKPKAPDLLHFDEDVKKKKLTLCLTSIREKYGLDAVRIGGE